MMSILFGIILIAVSVSTPLSVERADQEFFRMDYPLAQAMYDSVLGRAKDSANVLWRLARVYVCMADVSPDEQRLDLYRLAEAYAHRCIRADSMRSEGTTWRAAALGNIAMFEGGQTKVELCTLIKQELDRSIVLNPSDDIAYSILGSFYRALGNVSWIERQLVALFLGDLPEGGYDEAERALKKAITLAPGIIRHHFELAELYRELDRDLEALEEYRLVIALPVLLARDRRCKISAAGLITELATE